MEKESLEVRRHAAMESYREKNEYLLSRGYEEVTPRDFYRAIFPEGTFEKAGEQSGKPNAIAVDLDDTKHPTRWIVTDDLDTFEELRKSPFAITSPISYFGRNRAGRNARYLHAMAFDLDGVDVPHLRDLLYQMNNGILPMANFICNSGNGLHLYYIFEEPVPMYPTNQRFLRELKFALTKRIWNRYTSKILKPQKQGILQGFRIVGGQSKFGADYPVRAFRITDHAWSTQELIPYAETEEFKEQQKILRLMERESHLTMEEAKEKFPDWYERRIEKGEKQRKAWCTNRAVYEWWRKRMYLETTYRHRYFAIFALAIYARKCSHFDEKKNPEPVTEEELREDAYSFLEMFDRLTEDEENHFTADDIESALTAFHEDYITFPKRVIAEVTDIPIRENRRNRRKQEYHLSRARAVQAIEYPDGEWRNEKGRPKGSGTAEEKVRAWCAANPTGTKAACRRATNLDPKTIRKWWGE